MVVNHTNETNAYIKSITPLSSTWAQRLENDALEERIPILDRVSMQFLLQLIRLQQPKRILEVGTAIGYSALRMHEVVPNAQIVTLEKNDHMYSKAKENIAAYASTNQIEVIKGDALEKINKLRHEEATFDFVFIDAAKSQYKQYVIAIEPMLPSGSIIVADNVLFRHYVSKDPEEIPKRYKKLVQKLLEFNQFMMEHDEYDSSLLPVGDGLLISYKK